MCKWDEQMIKIVMEISPKYKNIEILNKQWLDDMHEQGIDHADYPMCLPGYWVDDYRKLNSLDRIAVLKDVVCNDLYKAEYVADYFQYLKTQGPVYCDTFKKFMNDHTSEAIIPDTINHTRFYECEYYVCDNRFFITYDDIDKIRIPIYWSAIKQWHDEHPNEFLISMDPPWGIDHICFSLEEVQNAILYGQTHGRSIGVSDAEFKKITTKRKCPFCRHKISDANPIGAWYLFSRTSSLGFVSEKYGHKAMPMCLSCHRIWMSVWDEYCDLSEWSLKSEDYINNLDDKIKAVFEIEGIYNRLNDLETHGKNKRIGKLAYAQKVRKVKMFLQNVRN